VKTFDEALDEAFNNIVIDRLDRVRQSVERFTERAKKLREEEQKDGEKK